ncbi:MAG TPA: hypothetical protein VNC16_11450 [Solirubrobacterales bacterium]|jgi:uncharacterized delta-60 repeat protein|nr:hypothetical protein [Solirubrobacterales bacterium]
MLVAVLLAFALPASAAAARISGEGSLGRTFSGDGRLLSDLDEGSKDKGSTVISYGERILAAGYSAKHPFGIRLAVAAYRPDGSLDPGFGDGGVVLSNVEGGMAAETMAIDSFGNIDVAGPSNPERPFGPTRVARLLPDGRLDPSFGDGDGMTEIPVDMTVAAVRTDRFGGVLLAGAHGEGGWPDGDRAFAVFQLTRDGAPDLSFGEGGLVTLDLSPAEHDGANDMMLDGFGRIVLVGGAYFPKEGPTNGTTGRFAIARLLPDGTLDTTFAGRGFRILPIRESGAFATAGALDVAGRAILAGRSGNQLAFAALRGSGRLDSSYGSGGIALHHLRETLIPADLADDSHKRVLTALEPTGSPSTPRRGLIRCWRLRADGSLDPRFSRDGRVSVRLGRYLGTARSVALQPNGGVLLGGWAKLPGTTDTDFALVRLRGGL